MSAPTQTLTPTDRDILTLFEEGYFSEDLLSLLQANDIETLGDLPCLDPRVEDRAHQYTFEERQAVTREVLQGISADGTAISEVDADILVNLMIEADLLTANEEPTIGEDEASLFQLSHELNLISADLYHQLKHLGYHSLESIPGDPEILLEQGISVDDIESLFDLMIEFGIAEVADEGEPESETDDEILEQSEETEVVDSSETVGEGTGSVETEEAPITGPDGEEVSPETHLTLDAMYEKYEDVTGYVINPLKEEGYEYFFQVPNDEEVLRTIPTDKDRKLGKKSIQVILKYKEKFYGGEEVEQEAEQEEESEPEEQEEALTDVSEAEPLRTILYDQILSLGTKDDDGTYIATLETVEGPYPERSMKTRTVKEAVSRYRRISGSSSEDPVVVNGVVIYELHKDHALAYWSEKIEKALLEQVDEDRAREITKEEAAKQPDGPVSVSFPDTKEESKIPETDKAPSPNVPVATKAEKKRRELAEKTEQLEPEQSTTELDRSSYSGIFADVEKATVDEEASDNKAQLLQSLGELYLQRKRIDLRIQEIEEHLL